MSAQLAPTASTARDRLNVAIATDRAERTATARADKTIAQRDQQIRVMSRAHEATRPSRSRKMAQDWGSANRIVGMDAKQLRDSARQRDRDHDVSHNALNVLVQNTVGSGIDIMPAPRKAGGEIDRGLAQALRDLWDDWWDRPEVTWRHDWGVCQQLIWRARMRDGESFLQTLSGPVDYLDHGTLVPFSIELLEADLVPLDFSDPARRILQGVERNAWGKPLAYHVYKTHPGDDGAYRIDTKRVPAEQVLHLAHITRMHQVRGLSIFASVLNRLVDIGEYEDYERIAAKVAASLSAQITKGSPEVYGQSNAADLATQTIVPDQPEYRTLTMRPGMIADDLLPGESIEVIDSKRPNPNAAAFVDAQLRRAAGGFGTSFSSLSLNYNGTYSAQRQELVEKWGGYQMLGEQFIAQCPRPVWQGFVEAAVLSGQVKVPRGWTRRELSAATYVRPVMPWIDPMKESLARGEQEDRGWTSKQQNTLLLGNDPEEVRRLREASDQQSAASSSANGDAPDDDTAAAARRLPRDAVVAHALQENT